MSVHINAEKGEIADSVLLPGDPLRAQFIAEKFLDDSFCYNEVRGMYGFTGYYNDKRISIQGTGMGIPSASIYINELLREYKVKRMVRVGSCGSLQKNIKLRDVILAQSASTNSGMNERRFKGQDYAPTANFGLLKEAYETARAMNIDPEVGNVLTCDDFYSPGEDWHEIWQKYGVLAAEMETAELYTLAARFEIEALSILTVSDSVCGGKETSAEERERTFTDMIKIALKVA